MFPVFPVRDLAVFSITAPCSSPALFFFLLWEGGRFLSLLKSHQSRSTPLTCNRLKHNRLWRVSNCTLFYGTPCSPVSLWTAGDCVIDTYSSFSMGTQGCTAVCPPQPCRHRNCTQAISRQAVFLDLSLQMPIRRLASFLSPSLLLSSHTKSELTNCSLYGVGQRQTIDQHHLLYSNLINHRLMRTYRGRGGRNYQNVGMLARYSCNICCSFTFSVMSSFITLK